jgi:hypothetical protein
MLLLVMTLELFARVEVGAALLAVVSMVVGHDSSPQVVAATAHVGLMWRAAADRRCAARTVPVFASKRTDQHGTRPLLGRQAGDEHSCERVDSVSELDCRARRLYALLVQVQCAIDLDLNAMNAPRR